MILLGKGRQREEEIKNFNRKRAKEEEEDTVLDTSDGRERRTEHKERDRRGELGN